MCFLAAGSTRNVLLTVVASYLGHPEVLNGKPCRAPAPAASSDAVPRTVSLCLQDGRLRGKCSDEGSARNASVIAQKTRSQVYKLYLRLKQTKKECTGTVRGDAKHKFKICSRRRTDRMPVLETPPKPTQMLASILVPLPLTPWGLVSADGEGPLSTDEQGGLTLLFFFTWWP